MENLEAQLNDSGYEISARGPLGHKRAPTLGVAILDNAIERVSIWVSSKTVFYRVSFKDFFVGLGFWDQGS